MLSDIGEKAEMNQQLNDWMVVSGPVRGDLAERRCLVLADGFYEWTKTPDGKAPYRFVRSDRAPFAFAGIWEEREDALGVVPSFAILTTVADAVVAPIHTRMPVILPPAFERDWIGSSRSPDEVLSMVKAGRGVALEAYPVSTLVNRASVDTPELIEPVEVKTSRQRRLFDVER